MAVFVFGAGATRGCEFVDPKKNPCLPPLDDDFFTQLQRIRNKKHKALVISVIKDVVLLFGKNFNVTLEMAYATFDQTRRMLLATRETHDFKVADLDGMQTRHRRGA